MDDALRSFDGVLAVKPTNLVALLGKVVYMYNVACFVPTKSNKARILYARRNFKEALRLFQDVLRYNPNCQPDPRIGIGLCFWAMDNKAKARAAWYRSLEVASDITRLFQGAANEIDRILPNGLLSYSLVSTRSMPVKTRSYQKQNERKHSSRARNS